MPRRNQNRKGTRRTGDAPDAASGSESVFGTRIERGPDGEDYTTRMIPGARATKTYRCPGCDHEVRPGVPHIVVWPTADFGGPDDRRHWHTGCWSGRSTRGLTRRWS